MSEFNAFKAALQTQYDLMTQHELFFTKVDKDFLYDRYLGAFPEGTNPKFRERTEHDCSCCKQFIRNTGAVVAIIDGKLVSIWDVQVDSFYQEVADALALEVKTHAIENLFRSDFAKLGTDSNVEMIGDRAHTWEHFYYELPNRFVKRDAGTFLSESRADKEVLESSLDKITLAASEIVLDLIGQGSLYKGDEFKGSVLKFNETKRAYDDVAEADKDNFLWAKSVELRVQGRFKNTAIGTLLEDISGGMDLEQAVRSYEKKVAPENYKRTTSLISQKMIDNAEKELESIGCTPSIARRPAVAEDLTVNNVLFADRSAKAKMGAFGGLIEPTKASQAPSMDNVTEISIEDFIKNVLPKATSLEVMPENTHLNNFMQVIAGVYPDAPNLFQWDNNFSWAYNGDTTDSIREKVKRAGGDVNGIFRASLAWYNYDDLDIHMIEPDGNHIYHGSKQGKLDVDMNAYGDKTRDAVENICLNSMKQGRYRIYVNNYKKRENIDFGFVVEIEFQGKVRTFVYENAVRDGANVDVITFDYSHDKGITVVKSLPDTQSSKDVWGVKTHQWQKVSMVMNSPNHWDGQEQGNKHWFFILEGCKNPEKARGFFNEYLRGELHKHRKVFEVLGSKMKCEVQDNQLSGVGFSSTTRNSLLCKVSGSFNRVVKIVF